MVLERATGGSGGGLPGTVVLFARANGFGKGHRGSGGRSPRYGSAFCKGQCFFGGGSFLPPRTLLITNFSTGMKTYEDDIPELIDDDDDIVTPPRIAAKRPEYTPMRDYPPSQQSSPGAHHNSLLTSTVVVNDLNVVDIFSQSGDITHIPCIDLIESSGNSQSRLHLQ